MIVSGEASGDIHGANLVKAIHQLDDDIAFYGMGGQHLAAAGVEILFEAQKVSVVGIAEVLTHLPDILSAQKILKAFLRQQRPALLIIIDFPDFNLMLASCAKKLGIPVFYYISPQVWAWRTGRVQTIKERVDRLGVILPFEEEFFIRHGVRARYVGHPLLDEVSIQYGREEFCNLHGIDTDRKLIAIIPGSRYREITSLLPVFLDSAKTIAEQLEQPPVFILPKASTVTMELLNECGLAAKIEEGLEIITVTEDRYEAMAACDAAVAASGTVTLELALLNVPMVVSYRTSPLTYFLGKYVFRISVENFSLVNLIAPTPFVLELLQDQVTAKNIANEISAILKVKKQMALQQAGLKDVRCRLGDKGASKKAAELAFELLG